MEILKNTKEICAKIYEDNCQNPEMRDFYQKLAKIIPDEIDVDNLVLAVRITLSDYEFRAGTATHFFTNIPRKIRPYTTDEFYRQFWDAYNRKIIGIKLPQMKKGPYSCLEIEPDVIDISNKNRNQVLAALYNASAPVGMGLARYKPLAWDEEFAEMAFQCVGKKLEDGGTRFDYVFGRPLRCTFKDNLVYVRGYNGNNAPGLAQLVISTLPDIEQKEKNPQKVKIAD